jgi:hypothetical protein
MDMFDMKIDNDLKMVDDTIREYYGISVKEENKESKEEEKNAETTGV